MNINDKLIEAAKIGNIEEVKNCLDNGVDIHTLNDCAFRWASKNNHAEVVRFLLNRGTDIHADNDYAFCWASKNGHAETVKVLKEHLIKEEMCKPNVIIEEKDQVLKIIKEFDFKYIDCDEEIEALRRVIKCF